LALTAQPVVCGIDNGVTDKLIQHRRRLFNGVG
jgi:hypothetical protein